MVGRGTYLWGYEKSNSLAIVPKINDYRLNCTKKGRAISDPALVSFTGF